MSVVPSPGVQILGAVFAQATSMTDTVPADRHFGGAPPLGVTLPALVLKSISRRKLRTVARGVGPRKKFERVQATALAADYETQAKLVAIMEDVGDLVIGDIAGFTAVSISWESTGPDLYSTDPPIFEQGADFLVSFTEAA